MQPRSRHAPALKLTSETLRKLDKNKLEREAEDNDDDDDDDGETAKEV
jgi:hypothetical protein